MYFMFQNEIDTYIQKYLQGTISEDEMHHLDKWYDSFDLNEELYTPGTNESNKILLKAFSRLKSKLENS